MSEPAVSLIEQSAFPTGADPPPPEGSPPAKKSTRRDETEAADEHEAIKNESNPFTESDWRMRIFAWSGLVVRLGFIVGGIFSLYQYLTTAEEKRVNGTFALLETWDRPEYQAAQMAVRQRIGELNKKNSNLLGKNPSQADLEFYMRRIGLKAMTADGGTMPLDQFKPEFDRLVYMLNRVATCVQAGQCSKSLTDDYFRDLSVSYWGYFSEYTNEIRANGSVTYSAPIEEYVTGKRPDLTAFFATSKK